MNKEEHMEELDDMIQRSFANDDPAARFPFKEAYWEQALALIEADEKRKKRRRFIWWRFAPLGLALLAVAAWWQLGLNATHHATGAGVTPATQGVAGSSSAVVTSNETAQATQPIMTDKPANTETRASAMTEKNNPPLQISPLSASKSVVLPKNSAVTPLNAQSLPDKEARNLNENSAPLTYTENIVPNENNLPPTAAPVESSAPAIAAQTALAGLTPTSDRAETDRVPVEAWERFTLPFLPYAAIDIGRPKPPVLSVPLSPAMAEPPTDVFRAPGRWSVGCVAATTLPFFEHQWRPQAGIQFGYRLNRRWSLDADIKMRAQRTPYQTDPEGNYLADVTYTNTRYSFGYYSKETLPVSLISMWLDAPVTMRYNRRHWSAEAGLGVSRRLTTYRYEKIARSESLAPDREIVDTRYRRYFPEKTDSGWEYQALTGLYWTPAARWQVGARLYRTLNPAPQVEPSAEPVNAWRSELLLRFRLF